MVVIFSETTTYLSDDFLAKLSEELLELTIENLKAIPGISCEKVNSTFSLKGQWHDLVTAYVSLEQCILDKEDDKPKVDDEFNKIKKVTGHETSPDIDYNFVTVKQERENPESEYTTGKNEDSVIKVDNNDSDDDTEIDESLSSLDDPNSRKKRKLPRNKKPNWTEKKFKTDPESNTCSSGFQCPKCNYMGKTDKNLDNHMARKHHKPFKCDKCSKRFGFKTDLDRHKIDVHEKTKNFFCNICNKYLKTKTYIDDHMSLHADNYVYQCKTCDKSFSTKQVFAKHMKQKHPAILFEVEDLDDILPTDDKNFPDGESPLDQSNDQTNSGSKDTSTLYNESSSIDYFMLIHKEEKVIHENNLYKITLKEGKNKGRPRLKSYMEQPDDRTEYPCHLCNYIGKKESHLENHIIRSHSQKFICDICQKQFGYNWDLKRHKEQVHAEASYFCHICSKAYKVKKSFDEHLRSHEEGYVKSVFPCEHCDKTFSAKQVLDNHVKVKHLGVKQKEKQKYLCQTCGAEFYHKYSYLSHMNKHAGLMPYNCDICGKAFASEHSVKEHQITHKEIREFHCHACPKSFKTSSALNAHVAIHIGKKNFKCSVCGKGFIQKQSLIRHERIHSGYKPYTCALCSRVFTDSATIRKHMILVHKSDPHDWQGDVISDLKKQGEFWLGDTTTEPRLEPDFRRKADRERYKEQEKMEQVIHETENASDKGSSSSDFGRNTEPGAAGQLEEKATEDKNMYENLQVEMNSDRNSGNLQSSESPGIHNQLAGVPESFSREAKKDEFWRGDSYMAAGVDSHRVEEMWQHVGARQGNLMQGEEMVELKRPSEYWATGMILDASRQTDYFKGGDIPDPRKQVEFWQGHSAADQKLNNETMHTQLTALQNMNFSSQS